MLIVQMAANIPVVCRYTLCTSVKLCLDFSTQGTRAEPEYVDHQFQCDPLDFVVEVLLPCSPLCTLLIDVSAAGTVALMKVKMDLQGQTPAKAHSCYTIN